jgi:hypothetical protein
MFVWAACRSVLGEQAAHMQQLAAGGADKIPPSEPEGQLLNRWRCMMASVRMPWTGPCHAGFAVVKRVTDRATGQAYAVKIMSLLPAGAEPTDNESTRWVQLRRRLGSGSMRGAWHALAPAGIRGKRGGRAEPPCPPCTPGHRARVAGAQRLCPPPHPRLPPSSEDIFKEIDILCCLDHDNVVALKEYFEEGNKARAQPAATFGAWACADLPIMPLRR